MRKALCLILALLVVVFMASPGYASEISVIEDDGMTGDVYAKYVSAVQSEGVALQGGSASAAVDGYTVSVSGAPGNAVTLRVVPIPSAEKEAWSWIAGCIDDNVTILTILDIYFQDSDGNRINASGVSVDINGADEDTIVFAVATNGMSVELDGSFTDDSLSFNANGSNYYVLAKKVFAPPGIRHTVTIENTDGGNVCVSSMNPKTEDTVTITVLPDAGKEIAEISVKTASGDKITLTDHGDGVYSYVQPNSDVTVFVSFEDKALPPTTEYVVTVKKSFGGSVEVSDTTPDEGQTVVITTKPDHGKDLHKITVTDENGRSIAVTNLGDGTYSYVQPNGNVTVQVTFKNKSIISWFDKLFEFWWGCHEKCDHSYTAVVTAPTCTDKGYTTYTCSKCSDSYKDAYTNALGHTWDNGVVTEEPTCTKNGVKIYTCETCKNQKTETIKATGHDYEDGICGSCGAEEPAKPSEPSKPNKPGWIFDWIFGGWWK